LNSAEVAEESAQQKQIAMSNPAQAAPTDVNKGGIAQLGERLHGMQEVSGSIPLTSTTFAGVVQESEVVSKDSSPLRLEA
jgi:hypothetical protein